MLRRRPFPEKKTNRSCPRRGWDELDCRWGRGHRQSRRAVAVTAAAAAAAACGGSRLHQGLRLFRGPPASQLVLGRSGEAMEGKDDRDGGHGARRRAESSATLPRGGPPVHPPPPRARGAEPWWGSHGGGDAIDGHTCGRRSTASSRRRSTSREAGDPGGLRGPGGPSPEYPDVSFSVWARVTVKFSTWGPTRANRDLC